MKKNTGNITIDDVNHIAKLANLKLTDEQIEKLTPQFSSVLELVSKIKELNTVGVSETSQVTGLENVFREDVVDVGRMLTQDEALSNAKKKHDGYFVVDAIFEE